MCLGSRISPPASARTRFGTQIHVINFVVCLILEEGGGHSDSCDQLYVVCQILEEGGDSDSCDEQCVSCQILESGGRCSLTDAAIKVTFFKKSPENRREFITAAFGHHAAGSTAHENAIWNRRDPKLVADYPRQLIRCPCSQDRSGPRDGSTYTTSHRWPRARVLNQKRAMTRITSCIVKAAINVIHRKSTACFPTRDQSRIQKRTSQLALLENQASGLAAQGEIHADGNLDVGDILGAASWQVVEITSTFNVGSFERRRARDFAVLDSVSANGSLHGRRSRQAVSSLQKGSAFRVPS